MKSSKIILAVLLGVALLWLWSVVPHWVFTLLVLLALIPVMFWRGITLLRRQEGERPSSPDYDASRPTLVVGDDFVECRHFMSLQNWDEARVVLQRIAYTIKTQPQATQDQFKLLMTDFAAQDPLIGGVARAVMPVLRAQPGVLQTALYQHVPGVGPEQVRYALYFLEQLNVIERKKSGRSYKVFEAQPIIDA